MLARLSYAAIIIKTICQPYNRPIVVDAGPDYYNRTAYLPLESLVDCPEGTHPISLGECASIPKRTAPLKGSCQAANAIFDEELKHCMILDHSPARLHCPHGSLIGYEDKKLCRNHARISPEDYCDPPYSLVDGMCEKRRTGPAEIGCLPGEKKEGFACQRAIHVKMKLKCPEHFAAHDTAAREGTCERKLSWKGVWQNNTPHCPPDLRDRATELVSGKLHPHVWVEVDYALNKTRKEIPEVICSQYEYTIGHYECPSPEDVPFEDWINPVSRGGHGNWPLLHYMGIGVGDPRFSCASIRHYPWRPVCPDFRGRSFVRTLMPQHNYYWFERPPGLIWAAGKYWVDLYKLLRAGLMSEGIAPDESIWNITAKSEVYTRPGDGQEEEHNLGTIDPAFFAEEEGILGNMPEQPIRVDQRTSQADEFGNAFNDRRMRRRNVAPKRLLGSKGGNRPGSNLSGISWQGLNRRKPQNEFEVEDDVGDPEVRSRQSPQDRRRFSAYDIEGLQQLKDCLTRALDQHFADGPVSAEISDVKDEEFKVYRLPRDVRLGSPIRSTASHEEGSQARPRARTPDSIQSKAAKYDNATMERPGPVDELPDPDDVEAISRYVNELIKNMYYDLDASSVSQDDLGVETLLHLLSPKPRKIAIASRLWVSWVHEGLILPLCVEYETRKPRQRCTDGFKLGTDMSCKPTDFAAPSVICPPEYNFEPESVLRWHGQENSNKPKRSSLSDRKIPGGQDLVVRTGNLPMCIGHVETYTDYYCGDRNCIADLEHRICVCDSRIEPANKMLTRDDLFRLWKQRGAGLYDMNEKYMKAQASQRIDNQLAPAWYPFAPTLFPLFVFRNTFNEVYTPEMRSKLYNIKDSKKNPEYAIYRAAFDPRDYVHWVRRKRDFETEYLVAMTADRILVISNRGKIEEQLHSNAFEPSEYNYANLGSARLSSKQLNPKPVENRYEANETRNDRMWERNGPPNALVASADQSLYSILRSYETPQAPERLLGVRSSHVSKLHLSTQSSGIMHNKKMTALDLYARPNLNRWRYSIRAPINLSADGTPHLSMIPEDYW